MRTRPLAALASLAFASLVSRRASADVGVSVDASQDARAVSPLIYGMNFPAAEQLSGARIPVARWGGNSTTRYNYEIDVTNTAADYFFENVAGCWNASSNYCATPPADPKAQSGANAFLKSVSAAGATALFTIPTIGWVAKAPAKYSHPFACGCTGPGQDSYDPFDGACGDGKKGGAFIDCGDPANTSVAVSPDWAKAWVTYLVAQFGPSNGKRVYALDNEPNLWNSTHHDIHKDPTSYDELWQKMRDYAVAILEADPTAEIAGPAEWGWPNYFCSAKDNISAGCFPTSPDRAAHGGTELVAWLLQQAKAYETQNGKRILHYLDLHYYPQGGDAPATIRSLWDPSYTDPSWINDKIRLVPRMHDWADKNYPGTKLLVSEYDFGHHNEPVGAVIYAEVLGTFAREGLDMATAWAPPGAAEAAFSAYVLFNNYDGMGARYEATNARATVDAPGVAAFAAAGPARMTVVLANEGDQSVTVNLTLAGFQPGPSAQVFSNKGGAAISKQGDVPVSGGAVSVTLAAKSIALVAIDSAGAQGAGGAGGAVGTGGGGAGGTGGGGAGGGAAVGVGGAGGDMGAAGGGASGSGAGGGAGGSGAAVGAGGSGAAVGAGGSGAGGVGGSAAGGAPGAGGASAAGPGGASAQGGAGAQGGGPTAGAGGSTGGAIGGAGKGAAGGGGKSGGGGGKAGSAGKAGGAGKGAAGAGPVGAGGSAAGARPIAAGSDGAATPADTSSGSSGGCGVAAAGQPSPSPLSALLLGLVGLAGLGTRRRSRP